MHRNILNTYCSLKAFQKINIHAIPFQSSYCILHQVKYKDPYTFINQKHRSKKGLYAHIFEDNIFHISERSIQYSSIKSDKEISKVENTVKVLKEKAKTSKDIINKLAEAPDGSVKESKPTTLVPATAERSIAKRIIDEIVHYYHGFRLLFINIRITSSLVWKILWSKELSRRENRLLLRTVADIFRLVPFSIFVLVPFLELLLPVVLKLFPAMLPSTFQTKSDKEKKIKAQLKLKMEMARFLQDTLDALAVRSKGQAHSNTAKEFAAFFEKIRSSDEEATNEEILQYCKLFEDELTLNNLPRPSLIAICRLLELSPIGTNNLLRFQLRMRLRTLKADDQMIVKEGIEALSVSELQAACRARGMSALGVPEDRLRSQLQQWLQLHLEEEIPSSLLLLSRALYLPENLPSSTKWKATLSTLSDTAAAEAKYKIGEIEGKVDYKTELDLIKKEQEAIKKEAEEMAEEKLSKQKEDEKKGKEQIEARVKDILTDQVAVLENKTTLIQQIADSEEKDISKEDIKEIENALENMSDEIKLLIEKEKIEELKEEISDYKENIENLKDVVHESGHEEVRESKAAIHLSKKVNKMISQMDILLDKLKEEQHSLEQQTVDQNIEGVAASKEKVDKISIDKLLLAVKKIQKVPDETRLQRISDVLKKMDVNHDGAVKVNHVLKVIEMLGKETVKINTKQMDEIIDLLMKEHTLKLEKKIKKQKKSEEVISQDKTG